jgi:uncharacterized protein YifE (UPF0438 family)
MNLDERRQRYLNKAPYPFDWTIPEGLFTTDEVEAINKYGFWFEAIWRGEVPLTTEKLKRFRGAEKMDPSERNKWEDLWVRYDREKCPF